MNPNPLPTRPITYRGYAYQVDGTMPQARDEPGRYCYVLMLPSGIEASEPVYSLITHANVAARESIDFITGNTPSLPVTRDLPDAVPAKRKKRTAKA